MTESVIVGDSCDKKIIRTRKASKKYYSKKIHTDPEFYATEKARIKEYKKNRYQEDPEYPAKCKAISRENYQRKKQLMLQTN